MTSLAGNSTCSVKEFTYHGFEAKFSFSLASEGRQRVYYSLRVRQGNRAHAKGKFKLFSRISATFEILSLNNIRAAELKAT